MIISNIFNKSVFVILILLLSTAVSSFSQEVKGRVTDDKNRPIGKANIKLVRDGITKNRITTNLQGKYHIWPIAQGAYQALISVDGYYRILQNIEIKKIDTTYIDFVLHKKTGILSN